MGPASGRVVVMETRYANLVACDRVSTNDKAIDVPQTRWQSNLLILIVLKNDLKDFEELGKGELTTTCHCVTT